MKKKSCKQFSCVNTSPFVVEKCSFWTFCVFCSNNKYKTNNLYREVSFTECNLFAFQTSGISDERSTQFHSNFDPVDASQSLFTTISTSTTPAVVNDNDGDSDSMVKDTSTQSVSLFSQTKCSPTRESQIETRGKSSSSSLSSSPSSSSFQGFRLRMSPNRCRTGS